MDQLNIKTILIILLSMINVRGFSANPDDGDYLNVFTKQSNIKVSYSLDDLDKITFSETGIRLWNTNWPTEYSYDNFRLISFNISSNTDAIEQVSLNQVDARITYDRIREIVCVESERHLLSVIVYDLQGRPVAKDLHQASSYEVSLSHIPRGVYVIKVNGGSQSASMRIVR